ncbi:MAG: CDP-alcohol phosphatidyltransferase family protein [Gulosibacter sp.]|uniref:CDP-alcohol phosphatidyltransferase family protein n=1 Tax=Gulosibacter sp. TaxID=2817531 RepID=UPI003F8E36B9
MQDDPAQVDSPQNGSAPGPAGLDRRNIPQRSTGWAKRAADLLATARLTPNSISVLSVVIAVIGAVALGVSGFAPEGSRWWLLVIAAVAIPLRLLCNMLDGMLAVEKGMHSPTGDLFNELPDRIADVALLVGAGFATTGLWVSRGSGPADSLVVDWGIIFGWLAAVLAVLTAYVRTLGAANGVGNFFGGPMAKPPRMWVLVVASLVSIAEPMLGVPLGVVLAVALVVIAVGSLITVVVRLRKITLALRAKDSARGADA